MSPLSRELRALAIEAGERMSTHASQELRPRLAQLLEEQARVMTLRAAGYDATTQEAALASSWGSVAVAERAIVQAEARDLALRAVATIARVAVAAMV